MTARWASPSPDVDENVAPEFAEDTTTREVEENTPQGGNIGGPVAAMAGDDDMLTPRQSCPPFPVRGFPAQLPDRHEPRQAPWWHRGRTGDLLNNQRPSELPITDWILNRLFGIDAFGYPTLDPTGETRLLCALCQNPTMLRKPFVLHHLQSSLAALGPHRQCPSGMVMQARPTDCECCFSWAAARGISIRSVPAGAT